jgi:gluconate 5-dehydrogenase
MNDALFRLDGKTALITGGSRGIGLAIAKGLAHFGADVVLVARHEKEMEKAKSEIQSCCDRQVWTFVYDVENIENIAEFFLSVTRQAGSIHILVNCAGTAARGPSEDFDLALWQKILQVNLSATFAFAQAFCRHRKEHDGSGKIINIGSLMCHGARPLNPPYAASKGGISQLTKELAVDWAKYNIQANVIAPGWFPTEMTAPLRNDPEFYQWVVSRTPAGRWGKTEDLVGAAVFLSSAASDFVTGQIIYVDGGWVAAM